MRNYTKTTPALAGFSLIEMMVSVAVLLILATVAVPSFKSVMARQDVRSLSSDLASDLVVARSEASRAGANATVCASSSGTACGGGSYALGWIVAVDFDRNGAIAANEIVRVHGAGPTGVTVLVSDGSVTSSFSANGRFDAPRRFTLCKSGVRGSIVDVLGSGVLNSYLTPADCA